MGWIIFAFIVCAILFAVLSIRIKKDEYGNKEGIMFKPSKRCVFALAGCLVLLLGSFTIVPANNVGVLYSAFGGTKETTIKEGFARKSIFDRVYEIPTEIQSRAIENIVTQTKDSQFVTSSINVKYSVSEQNAYVVFKKFKTLENMADKVIADSVQTNLEAITTKYNVFDALGEMKPIIQQELATALMADLEKYGVKFDSVTILDMDGGATVEEAIAAEAKAQQAIEIATKQVEESKILAQKQVEEAKAKKEAAEINAETVIIEATAKQQANELLKASLSELINIYEWIQKWDGHTPEYYGGDGTDLIFNAGTLD